MEYSCTQYTADKLFEIHESDEILGTPKWMNLIFRQKGVRGKEFGGAGIYACFYNSELIYIGKFLGKKSSMFLGDVASMRWVKHTASFTLRGRKQSFSRKSVKKIAESEDFFPKEDIIGADSVAMTRDRGVVSTYNRYLFAAQNWNNFQKMTSRELEDFSFLYVRVHDIYSGTDETLRKLISRTEDNLVSKFRPRCNAVIERGSHLEGMTLEIVKNGIIDAISGSSMDESMGESMDTKSRKVSEDSEEPEDVSAETFFVEKVESTSSNGVELIREIIQEFGDRSGVEVHFSHVPDLRIRAFGVSSKSGKEVSQNIFRFEWRIQTQSFLCEIYTPVNEMPAEFNAVDNSSGPLPTKFRLDNSEEKTDAKKLFGVIQNAVLEWRTRC